MNPTIEQLRVVCAVARLSSFSEAARELMLTQPAITRTVRSVETGQELSLFNRTTRRVEVTSDGAEFVSVSTEILRAYDDGLARLKAWRRAEAGAITVLVLPSLAAGVVAPIIAGFLRDRPGVQLDLVTANAEGILKRLRAGEAQLAITEDPGVQSDLDIASLAIDPVFAVVPDGHPLAAVQNTTWRDLANYPFVQLDEGTSVRRLTDAGFRAAGALPTATLSADTIGSVSALIAQGLGVSAFPGSTRPLVTSSGIRFVGLGEPDIARKLSIVSSRAPRLTHLARELRREFVEAWNAGGDRQ
jgi:LysR family transcriptional regulator, carnitine catabolism transcriptional activator